MRIKDINEIRNPALRKQVALKLDVNKEAKLKHGNQKTKRTVKGKVHEFDSLLEARHYDELLMRERAGQIKDLNIQVPFELIPTLKHNGKTLRKISYYADFVYLENGKKIVVDTKGFKRDVYKIKMRLFLMAYPECVFKEVTAKQVNKG